MAPSLLRLAIGVAVLVAASMGRPLAADEPPFPQPHITAEQWQAFYDEVKAKPGAVVEPPVGGVVRILVESEYAFYHFTTEGPAHPAVIIERILQLEDGVYVQSTGYFAGSEPAFAAWFAKVRESNAMLEEHLKSKQ
jgi:hypothetical protein